MNIMPTEYFFLKISPIITVFQNVCILVWNVEFLFFKNVDELI